MKTLLIMAGGTGGHVMPALAVAKNLRSRGVNIVWMGTAHGIEHELVPAAGFELRLVKVKGIRRSGLVRKISAPFLLLYAAMQALNIIIRCKANAILGMGGYVSGPGGLVGRLLFKPLVLHEQNAVAGTTNKLLAPFARHVLTGFDRVEGLAKGEHVGNPVRPEIVAIKEPSARLKEGSDKLKLLVVGGSQGAQIFNENLPRLFAELQSMLGQGTRLSVMHQCGKDNAEDVRRRYLETGLECEVQAFIEDMAAVYADIDLVICRAGAMTVAEVAAAGVVALFVPLPSAIDDHQFYNAKALSDDQAALCFRQIDFLKGEWIEPVAALAGDRPCLIDMAGRARAHSSPGAAERVADVCMEVLNA